MVHLEDVYIRGLISIKGSVKTKGLLAPYISEVGLRARLSRNKTNHSEETQVMKTRKLYSAIDLHSNNLFIAIVDAEGKRIKL